MSTRFDQCADVIHRLCEAIHALASSIESFELPALATHEWYELLQQKLRPQLGKNSYLVVAVVGGTNIGKSVIFNHIAGGRVSATSPMASGTKHPTVLVPVGFAEQNALTEIFPGFDVREWENPDAPLKENAQHFLFWSEQESLPANLVVLDTPDVDSVAEVNWERADQIRRSADVLIAVLTQQKYNDAAVKQFFRHAADEGKLVIVVFNQVLMPEDEPYWPLWLKTFEEETSVFPHSVYLAPNDRRAAESNTLPFFEQTWPVKSDQEISTPPEPRNLLKDLSELRFSEIKVQTLEGAIRHLCSPGGIPGWLDEIRLRGNDFRDALELMSSQQLVEVDRWPTVPNQEMIKKVRLWWSRQREGWSKNVHGFYNTLGTVVSYPVKFLMDQKGTQETPMDLYRQREWEAILQAIDRTLERLTMLRNLDNPRLSPRLDEILSGNSRVDLIERIRNEHQKVNFDRILDELIEAQLQNFQEESPQSYKLFRRLDTVAAAARPAVSVALFMTGAGPVGNAIFPAVADSAMQGVLHVASDAVGGTVVTAVGDKVITEGASTGAGYLETKFRKLHTQFTSQRAAWLAAELDTHLFGSLPADLSAASMISDSTEYRRVKNLVDELRAIAITESSA